MRDNGRRTSRKGRTVEVIKEGIYEVNDEMVTDKDMLRQKLKEYLIPLAWDKGGDKP